MDSVILKVVLQDGQAPATLKEIDALATKLSASPIKIQVDTSGLQKLDKEMRASLSAQAKLLNAQARMEANKVKEAQAQAKVTAEMEKTAQAEAKAAAEHQKAVAASQRVAEEALKGETIEKRRVLLAEQMAASYDRAALSAQRMNVTGSGNSDTAIQQRINSMVGLGQATKSAAESANVFNSFQQRFGEYLSTGNAKLTGGVSAMAKYIQSLDGMSNATVKATGFATDGSRVFQTYTATVKQADGSFRNYAYSVDTASGATYQMNQGITSVDKAATHMGDTFTNLIGKVAKWAVVTAVVYTPIRKLKEAAQELKAVDTEMVTIQKVTGQTIEQLENLADAAYETAASYGATASTYVGSVAEFAKAGYGTLADELGELALKTQTAGDVEKETANQFLLSVDAAYKYRGNIEALNAVLDGANQIGNEYATSVQKVADGLGIVAPVAASAKISIGELTAAIGTITAVTQRSGSEAARALRALILNIQGDVSSEINEDTGERWSQEEIDAMSTSLQKFGIYTETVTNGLKEMRNPMEVIGEMSQKFKEGIITEYDLNRLVSDMGGKLRSNQLMALIQHWDMYESMLETYKDSAGSADRELAIYLESWESKLNQCSAAWTQFVAGFGIEEAAKDVLDFGTAIFTMADNDLARLIVQVTATTAAVSLLNKGYQTLKTTASVTEMVSKCRVIISTMSGMTASAADLRAGMSLLTGTLLKSPLFWGVAAGLVIFGLPKMIDAVTVSLDEQREKVEELQGEYDKLTGAGNEYDQLIQKGDDLTEVERNRLNILKLQKEELEEQLRLAQEQEFEKFQKEQGSDKKITNSYSDDGGITWNVERTTGDRQKLDELSEAWNEYSENLKKGTLSEKDYRDSLRSLVVDQSDYYESLVKYRDLGYEISSDQELFILKYEAIARALGEDTAETEENTAAKEENTSALKANADASASAATILSTLSERYDVLKTAQDEVNESGYISADTLNQLLDKYPELEAYLVRTADGYTLTEGALQAYLAAQREEYRIALNDAITAAESLITSESLKAEGYNKTTEAIIAQLEAQKALYTAGTENSAYWSERKSKKVSEIDDAIANIRAAQKNYDTYSAVESTVVRGKASGSSSGSSSVTAARDAAMDELEAWLEDQEHQIFLFTKQGGHEKEIIALYQRMQERVHALAEEYRAKGYTETSDEIQKLQKLHWEYADEIESVYESIAERQKELWNELEAAVDRILEQAAKERDAKLDAIDQQIDDLKRQQEEENNLLALEEKRLAVEEARLALQEVNRERNIRQMQEDGTWAWVADQEKVASAEQALQDAKDELREYERQAAYDELIANLEAEKDRIQAEYTVFEEQWSALKGSIEEPTRDISEILDDIAENVMPSMKESVQGVVNLLNELSGMQLGGAGLTTTGSLPFSGGGNVEGEGYSFGSIYDANRDYAADMLNAANEDEFHELAMRRDAKIKGEGITGVQSNQDLYEQWQSMQGSSSGSTSSSGTKGSSKSASNTKVSINKNTRSGSSGVGDNAAEIFGSGRKSDVFDEGGIASGKGFLSKNTHSEEMVLGPEMTKMVLAPQNNAQFSSFTQNLADLFGMAKAGFTAGSVSTTDRHDVNYFINGVKIGQDMVQKPLSEVLSAFALYRE